jgi:hypothetical protein
MPHPRNPDVVYGNCKGQYEWMNLKTGQSKRYWVGGQSLYGNPGQDLILGSSAPRRWRRRRTIPEIVYYGSQYLHRTRDKGVTWEKISPDLTAFDPRFQGASGEPITRDVTGEEFYSTLYAITESPLERGVIWTGLERRSVLRDARQRQKLDRTSRPRNCRVSGRPRGVDSTHHRIARVGVLSRSIAICSAITSRTSIAPTITERRGRA